MITKLRSCIFVSALSLAYSGMALATTAFDHGDYYDAGSVKLGGYSWSGGTTSATWTFDIVQDGYDPTTESVTSAIISLELRDDKYDPWKWKYSIEKAQLTAGDTVFDTFIVDTGTQTFTLNSLVTLSETGLLEMTLEAVKGDFIFDSAALYVHDEYAVPVPAAVWLFGSGLLGLIGVARTKKQA